MRRGHGSLTFWSVAALAAGIVLGLLGHLTGSPLLASLGAVSKVAGGLWLSALRLISLPLALTLLLAAITNARTGKVGALTVRALAVFATALVVTGVLTFALARGFLGLFPVASDATRALASGITIPAEAAAATIPSAGDWLGSLVPANLFEAAVRGQIFPLLLFAIVFALAVTRLPDDQRAPLAHGFQALAQATLVLVRWLLVVTPAGVFALGYVLALESGASLAGILGVYLLIQAAVTLLWILLIYPVTAVVGRVRVADFARAVLPAQVVAATTRSSVAALPALVEGGRQHLALPDTAISYALPLSVSLFRISEVILNGVKLIFLARLYGVTLHPGTLAAFLITAIVFSFSGTGTPNSGGGIGFRMVPVFVAAGIPIQGAMLLEVVETIPDIFATVVNVTGQMGASTIISRWSARRVADPSPA